MDSKCLRVGLCVGLTIAFGGNFAFAWTSIENSILSSTKFAPGIINQSFRASHYFYKPEEYQTPQPFVTTSFVPLFKKSSEEVSEFKPPREFWPLVWTLAAGYQRAESPSTAVDPALVDETFSGTVGLAWEVSRYWKPGLQLGFDLSNSENYGHGVGLLTLEFNLPLRRNKKKSVKVGGVEVPEVSEEYEKPNPEYDPRDALQFYAHEKKMKDKKKQEVKLEEGAFTEGASSIQGSDDRERGESDFAFWQRKRSLPLPYLKFKFSLGAGVHGVGNKTFRRASLGGRSVVAQSMTQFHAGVDLVLVYKKRATYTAGFYGYFYNSPVDNFISVIEADTFRRQPIVAHSGVLGFDNLNLAFPMATLDQRGEWKLNEKEILIFEVNESFYSSSTQPPIFGFSQTYLSALSKNWRGGVTGVVLFGGVSEPLLSLALNFDYVF